jgi:hypothetical protein
MRTWPYHSIIVITHILPSTHGADHAPARPAPHGDGDMDIVGSYFDKTACCASARSDNGRQSLVSAAWGCPSSPFDDAASATPKSARLLVARGRYDFQRARCQLSANAYSWGSLVTLLVNDCALCACSPGPDGSGLSQRSAAANRSSSTATSTEAVGSTGSDSNLSAASTDNESGRPHASNAAAEKQVRPVALGIQHALSRGSRERLTMCCAAGSSSS